MRKIILTIGAVCVLLLGCAVAQDLAQGAVTSVPDKSDTVLDDDAITPDNNAVAQTRAEGNVLPDRLFETYYLSSEESVYTYLQNKSIHHKFNSISRPGEAFYTCTFSADDGRCGYIIVSYGEGKEGPYISKWSLNETTPYQYDLRANSSQIGEALNKTDIDLSTASAMRVEWIDTDKKRGDRIVLFTDGKDDKYVCYFGDGDFTLHKVDGDGI